MARLRRGGRCRRFGAAAPPPRRRPRRRPRAAVSSPIRCSFPRLRRRIGGVCTEGRWWWCGASAAWGSGGLAVDLRLRPQIWSGWCLGPGPGRFRTTVSRSSSEELVADAAFNAFGQRAPSLCGGVLWTVAFFVVVGGGARACRWLRRLKTVARGSYVLCIIFLFHFACNPALFFLLI